MDTLLGLFPSPTSKGATAANQKIDYANLKDKEAGIRFLHECGMKLDAKFSTLASASVLYHRFFIEANPLDYDVYLIAASCLYMAGKLEDQVVKARDVINVTQATLKPGGRPLDMDDSYWNLRDALIQAELLILRMLRFDTDFEHPHKYMLHYLVSLQNWMGDDVFQQIPVRRTAWTLLRDSYMDPFVLEYKPQLIALAAIHLALQCYGIAVPSSSEEGAKTWYQVFCPSCTREELWEVTDKILDVYGREEQLMMQSSKSSISSAVFA